MQKLSEKIINKSFVSPPGGKKINTDLWVHFWDGTIIFPSKIRSSAAFQSLFFGVPMKFLESFSKTSCDFFETGCYDSGKSKIDSAEGWSLAE